MPRVIRTAGEVAAGATFTTLVCLAAAKLYQPRLADPWLVKMMMKCPYFIGFAISAGIVYTGFKLFELFGYPQTGEKDEARSLRHHA
jgi:hypothetical protein